MKLLGILFAVAWLGLSANFGAVPNFMAGAVCCLVMARGRNETVTR